ncbi:DHHW family protein [Lacinutrix iliipiscaria]|uniref:DHHW family protein n=1 Tax=Lacinutrix iliipiscaria TaxID=1230532 RepID=A0ABW5WJJ5_9FLAO
MIYTKKRSTIVIILFLALLLIPNLLMFTDLEKKSQFANLTTFPDLKNETKRTAFTKLKKYYLEHYGLKSSFVDFYINIKSNILNEDPLPNRVVKGSDDWYFLGNHHNNVLNNTFGMQTYSKIDLHIMRQNLKNLNDYLTHLGVSFYFVVAPNKSTIYKENLPFNIQQKPTPITQFLATIKPSDHIKSIDLRSTLRDKKEQNQLYIKTDTHWNSHGAYFAYEHIMKQVIKDYNQLSIIPLSYFEIKKDTFQGDITRMINNYNKETIINYNKPANSSVETIVNSNDYHAYKNINKDLKLLMYRDSFGFELFPFLNETFNEVVYVKYNKNISQIKIENENPDIFILEVSERNFDVLLKELRLAK